MNEYHVRYLACPACAGSLEVGMVREREAARIVEGELTCVECEAQYPVIRAVPRFVDDENYAANFGFEWNLHRGTQLDSQSGTSISEERFFTVTKWPRDLTGEVVLEVGSGAGRFTEQAAGTGATVVSLDYSAAVDANYEFNGERENVLIVQGDLYRMPVPTNSFHRVFCFGVLQHTPDPEHSFKALLPPLKRGGALAIDVYAKRWWTFLRTKYWVRPLTRHMKSETLYSIVDWYIRKMWPIARLINRLPFGRKINSALLISDYRGRFPLTEEQLREWAVLDTFDRLSPTYDRPQTLPTVRRWFTEAGLEDIEVVYGWNGVNGRGIKQSASVS